jgi:hypothetical protein
MSAVGCLYFFDLAFEVVGVPEAHQFNENFA